MNKKKMKQIFFFAFLLFASILCDDQVSYDIYTKNFNSDIIANNFASFSIEVTSILEFTGIYPNVRENWIQLLNNLRMENTMGPNVR